MGGVSPLLSEWWKEGKQETNEDLRNTEGLGNRRNTVSRVLFRKRDLTEFCSKLRNSMSSTSASVSSVWHTTIGWRNSMSSLPRTARKRTKRFWPCTLHARWWSLWPSAGKSGWENRREFSDCTQDKTQTSGNDFMLLTVPEGHHPRGTTLREALRGDNLPLRGILRGVCAGLFEGSAGLCEIFRREWTCACDPRDCWSVTLPALQKNFVNIFSCLTGNFALKNGGDFWWSFFWSVSHETKNEKSSKKSGKNSEQNSGQNSGRKFEKFGKLPFCNFPDLMKNTCVIFWVSGFETQKEYPFVQPSAERRKTSEESGTEMKDPVPVTPLQRKLLQADAVECDHLDCGDTGPCNATLVPQGNTCKSRTHLPTIKDFYVRFSQCYEAQNDYTIIRKPLLCVTDMRAIGKLLPREFLCVIGVHTKYLKYPMEAPELHKIFPAKQPCVKDVLSTWEINSQIMKCVCV